MTADRSAYTAGLRALADIIDATPELPLPYHGHASPITFHFLSGPDVRTRLAAAVRAIPGRLEKSVALDGYFQMEGQIEGLLVNLTSYRDEVCQRIVVGTREVVREVPDPDALAAVPTTTVTETVEDVRWECTPLLADVAA